MWPVCLLSECLRIIQNVYFGTSNIKTVRGEACPCKCDEAQPTNVHKLPPPMPWHKKVGEIALNVKHMNVKPGKQAMRDTNRNGQMQTLVLPDGRAKGLKMVLEEKGVDTTRMVADECMRLRAPFLTLETTRSCWRRGLSLVDTYAYIFQRSLWTEFHWKLASCKKDYYNGSIL